MSTTPSTTQSQPASNDSTIRDALIGALFALVLLLPRLLDLRRNARPWLLVRIFLGLAGAALVLVPLGLSNGYIFSIVGLSMFAAAILLPSAAPEMNTERKARQLGALAVVKGGRFQLAPDTSVSVRLFVGAERIDVLDSRFQTLLVVPVNEITYTGTAQFGHRWILEIDWPGSTAAFSYRGTFAGRFARLAESTVRSVMRPSVPAIPQALAARA
jgi:hypothetical protein